MICKKCKIDKGNDFRKKRTICRECDNALARERRKKEKERVKTEKPTSILCKKCNKICTDFTFNRKVCSACRRERGRKYRRNTTKSKEWTENNKERMKELQKNWYEKNKHTRKCSKNSIKRNMDLVKHKEKWTNVNKELLLEKRWIANKELKKAWIKINDEVIKEFWKRKVPPKVNKTRKEINKDSRRKRMASNPKWKEIDYQLNACRRFLNTKSRYSKHVNCSPSFFRDWLQFQFFVYSNLGMTLENHGKLWEFDHVLPCSLYASGDLSKEIVLNWQNIRPLLKDKNQSKYNYIKQNDCKEHLKNLKQFIKIRKLDIDDSYIDEIRNYC